MPRLVALFDQFGDKTFIASPIRKIAAASHAQGLIKRLFEAVVGLLDIPVFMSDPGIVPGRLQLVVAHQ